MLEIHENLQSVRVTQIYISIPPAIYAKRLYLRYPVYENSEQFSTITIDRISKTIFFNQCPTNVTLSVKKWGDDNKVEYFKLEHCGHHWMEDEINYEWYNYEDFIGVDTQSGMECENIQDKWKCRKCIYKVTKDWEEQYITLPNHIEFKVYIDNNLRVSNSLSVDGDLGYSLPWDKDRIAITVGNHSHHIGFHAPVAQSLYDLLDNNNNNNKLIGPITGTRDELSLLHPIRKKRSRLDYLDINNIRHKAVCSKKSKSDTLYIQYISEQEYKKEFSKYCKFIPNVLWSIITNYLLYE